MEGAPAEPDARVTVLAVGEAPGSLAGLKWEDLDGDIDTEILALQLVSGPASGTLTLNPDRSFTYTPNPNFFGQDSFTYQATDGQALSNVATVRITVDPVNDAPVAADDAFTVDEDTVLAVPARRGLQVEGEGAVPAGRGQRG